MSGGIWDDAAFANYVAIVEHGSSKMVGILEGLYGTSTLLVALPFGTLADRWRRDRVLRICGILELGALSSRQLMRGHMCCLCGLKRRMSTSSQQPRPGTAVRRARAEETTHPMALRC